MNVREVRGKVMELLREPTALDPGEVKHPGPAGADEHKLTVVDLTSE